MLLHDADIFGAERTTNRAIIIRLKNPAAVARQQGALASFAASLAPATTESEVYSRLAGELRKELKSQHVDADVIVAEPEGWQLATKSSPIGWDLGYILGGVGVFGVLVWIVTKGKGKR